MVEGAYFYLNFEKFFDILAIVLSSLIILNFSISVYYGIKMMILKQKNKFGWCPEMLVTYESILWVIVFSYIIINTFLGKTLIDNASFGAIFIRPLIFLTSIITLILQKRRYWNAITKYQMEDFLKQKSEQEE